MKIHILWLTVRSEAGFPAGAYCEENRVVFHDDPLDWDLRLEESRDSFVRLNPPVGETGLWLWEGEVSQETIDRWSDADDDDGHAFKVPAREWRRLTDEEAILFAATGSLGGA